MKKFTTLFENYSNSQEIARISSKDEFSMYVHEQLSTRDDYSRDKGNMIVEQLSSAYGENWQDAAKELENFQ